MEVHDPMARKDNSILRLEIVEAFFQGLRRLVRAVRRRATRVLQSQPIDGQ